MPAERNRLSLTGGESKERAALFCRERAADGSRFPMTARGKNTVKIALKLEASTGIDKEL